MFALRRSVPVESTHGNSREIEGVERLSHSAPRTHVNSRELMGLKLYFIPWNVVGGELLCCDTTECSQSTVDL